MVFLAFAQAASDPTSSGALAGASPAEPIFGDWQRYITNTVNDLYPAVAYNSSRNEYLVVWEQHQATEIAIFARRVAGDGSSLGNVITIANWATYTATHPGVAYSPVQDKYLVVLSYDSKPSGGGTDYMVSVQEVYGDGSLGAGKPIAPKTNDQVNPTVTYNEAWDEFLVVWEEEQGDGGWRDIWAQRLRASDLHEHPGPVNIATGGDMHRIRPDVAYNPAVNGYLIAYSRDYSIFGKIAAAHLDGVGPSSEIEIVFNTYVQINVSIASGGDAWLVVWEDGPGPTWRTIYARWVVSDVVKTPSPAFEVEGEGTIVYAEPDVAFGEGFGFLVGWSGALYPPTDYFNMGRYVFLGPNALADESFGVDPGPGNPKNPAVACTPTGDCLYVEARATGGYHQIYGRLVSPLRVYLPLVAR
jgi:hypothetical protein